VAKIQEENKKLNARIADLEAENSSLKKLNDWYIEYFKLRQKD
jgi:BMFP domain-containing protein YqiC